VSYSRVHKDGLERCSWLNDDPIYIDYHDKEWGRRATGQRDLFEAIALEGFQAGLSWLTILKRREGFRRAFHNFDIPKVAAMTEADVERLMQDAGIIRNRAKITATIHNANLIQDLKLDLKQTLWSFAPENPKSSIENFEWFSLSKESVALSKRLQGLGFKFVGPTTMYALMQSTGMIHDHAPNCHWRE
jgi:DNA-3-methyladenine glycosylase I